MKKMTCAVLALLSLTTTSFAATTTESNKTTNTSFKDYYQSLKASPFGLLILADTAGSRKINGLSNETLFYMDYKFGENKVSVIPSFSLDNTTSIKTPHIEYGYTQLRYTRSNILTEEESGVSLSAQLRAYINNDNTRAKGNDTTLRPKIELKKSWGKFSLFNDTSLYLYQNNEDKTNESKTMRFLVQVTPAYQITDKLAVSIDLVSYTELFEKDANTQRKINATYNVAYYFDSGIGLTGYFDTTAMTSDKQIVMQRNSDFLKDASIGAVLTYKVF